MTLVVTRHDRTAPPVKNPLPADAGDVMIFQNYYQDGQERSIDPAFVPRDGRHNANTHYREVALFARMYHSGLYKRAAYTGIVSPKFWDKTRLAGSDFIRFIRANPGHDVYFVNPYPGNAYYTFNIWEHGELCHDGLILLASDLFDRAGIEFDPASMGRNSHSTLLYSNYWVGNERFWHGFMALNLRLLDTVERLPPSVRQRYFMQDPNYPDPVPLLPFIFERLFSTFLLMDPTIRGLPYPHSRHEILRAAERDNIEPPMVQAFMDLIDEIDRRGDYSGQNRRIFGAIYSLRRHLESRGF
jgi:hypothetical protein